MTLVSNDTTETTPMRSNLASNNFSNGCNEAQRLNPANFGYFRENSNTVSNFNWTQQSQADELYLEDNVSEKKSKDLSASANSYFP